LKAFIKPSAFILITRHFHMDSATSEKIFALFKKLNADGLSLVIVTHNADLAAMASRVIELRDSAIVAG
jgi:putative ABC transport system ATP-binding protein